MEKAPQIVVVLTLPYQIKSDCVTFFGIETRFFAKNSLTLHTIKQSSIKKSKKYNYGNQRREHQRREKKPKFH